MTLEVVATFSYFANLKMQKSIQVISKFVKNPIHIRCHGSIGKVKPEYFSKSRRGDFFQEQPVLSNPFENDKFLQRCLKRLLPEEVYRTVSEDLLSFGYRLCTEIDCLGRKAELEPPKLRHYDAWGNRIDDIITSQAWKDLNSISAEEGLVALAYERSHHQWSRLHQMAKLFLFAPSSGLYTCPLAMTDGAAKLIELSEDNSLKENVFPKLTTRNPKQFWSSGQWMTEREGGSDVGGGTSTVAKGPFTDNSYQLYGYKWFSSAADAHIAFTLARIVDKDGLVTKGIEGLSLFYLETRTESRTLNNIEIQHLKNKLGTRQLPTGELLLDGTKAYLFGKEGEGIKNISPMLNTTRLHNSVAAIGNMRRMLQLCADYSTKRVAFGKHLCKHSLHMQTLSRIELLTRGCTVFVLEVSRLLGRSECSLSTSCDEILLRILTPVLKLYTAKQAILVASEGLEAFGGQGYIEDTGLPTMLRDAQVLSIWEGTTNILSLDVVRVLVKHREEVIQSLSNVILDYLSVSSTDKDIQVGAKILMTQLEYLVTFLEASSNEDSTILYRAARDFSFTLAHVYIGALLISHASMNNSSKCDKDAAIRWCNQLTMTTLGDVKLYTESEFVKDVSLVLN